MTNLFYINLFIYFICYDILCKVQIIMKSNKRKKEQKTDINKLQ